MSNSLFSEKKVQIFISEKSDGSMKLLGGFGDEKILDNRKIFLGKIGIDLQDVVSADLEHGTKVEIVGKNEKGIFIKKTDGLVTKEKNIFLTVTVADCLPIFIYTETGVGILHGGWRGVADGVVENGIKKFKEMTNCLLEEIFLKVGPSIDSCCFEVGNDVAEVFQKYSEAVQDENGRKFVDLKKVVQQIALQEGLLEERIDISSECTACLPEKYFSFRRDKPEKVEAMMAGIGLVCRE